MLELLGRPPRGAAATGRHAREFFNREGRLRHIRRLNEWPLERVLGEKYRMPPAEVRRETRKGGARENCACALRAPGNWVGGLRFEAGCALGGGVAVGSGGGWRPSRREGGLRVPGGHEDTTLWLITP
jgi:hypothetical protein